MSNLERMFKNKPEVEVLIEFNLSYDVLDSTNNNSEKVKKWLVANILDLDIFKINNPVSSTLVFSTKTTNREATINNVYKFFKNECYDVMEFRLSVYLTTSNLLPYMESSNEELEDNFIEIYNEVIRNINKYSKKEEIQTKKLKNTTRNFPAIF